MQQEGPETNGATRPNGRSGANAFSGANDAIGSSRPKSASEAGVENSAALRPSTLGLVLLGGTLGVYCRELLTLVLPEAWGLPVGVLVANLLGALLLGLLLHALEGSRRPRAQQMRLLLGTGLLGGFTTYSALTLAMTLLVNEGQLWLALGYGLGTVVFGCLATCAGMAFGGLLRRSQFGVRENAPGLDDE